MSTGKIGVSTGNLFPIIKKFLYSDHDIFLREIVSNAVDASQKMKVLASNGEFKGELGELKVRVKADKAAGTLTVSDNGVGMDKQTAADFLTVQSGGYGARNVNERLKLYYGDQYPLKVDSKQGEGTTITITFPARVYTTQKQA